MRAGTFKRLRLAPLMSKGIARDASTGLNMVSPCVFLADRGSVMPGLIVPRGTLTSVVLPPIFTASLKPRFPPLAANTVVMARMAIATHGRIRLEAGR